MKGKVDKKDRRVVILYTSINWRTGWATEGEGIVPLVHPSNSSWPGRRAPTTTTSTSPPWFTLSRRKQQQVNSYQQQQKFRHFVSIHGRP